MTGDPRQFQPGHQIRHAEFGEGVVVGLASEGYLRVFFTDGERQVPEGSVQSLTSWAERVIENVDGNTDRLKQAWLACEAHSLPLMESAAALTAAPIDLLPHQIVLTHRIATRLTPPLSDRRRGRTREDYRDRPRPARVGKPWRAGSCADDCSRGACQQLAPRA